MRNFKSIANLNKKCWCYFSFYFEYKLNSKEEKFLMLEDEWFRHFLDEVESSTGRVGWFKRTLMKSNCSKTVILAVRTQHWFRDTQIVVHCLQNYVIRDFEKYLFIYQNSLSIFINIAECTQFLHLLRRYESYLEAFTGSEKLILY